MQHPRVVGIAAGVGGLDPLRALLAAVPARSGLSFVVAADFDSPPRSLGPAILGPSAGTLRTRHAKDGQAPEPNHVYVASPDHTVAIRGARLTVRKAAGRSAMHGKVDRFFRSLALDQGARGIAIVLSGSGTDGTIGARAVKAAGGLVIAQDPSTASQPDLPAGAIAAGIVDCVLPPEQMADALLDYVDGSRTEEGGGPVDAPAPSDDLESVLAALRARTGRNFAGYRKTTLERRIARRMALMNVQGMAAYAEVLLSHATEPDRLAADLLIGMTSFFRNPTAFDELARRVLSRLVRTSGSDTPVRIWVPGCATGEEAYSIAIIAAEEKAAARSGCSVHIFATDVDGPALDIARSGTYAESIARDVTPERLQRFFTRDGDQYRIAKALRGTVTVAVQDLLVDPPLPKLDLVSCRHVLIHLEPEMQTQALARLHFALNPGGHLFLGHGEGVGRMEGLFTPVSAQHGIFRKAGSAARVPLGPGALGVPAVADSAALPAASVAMRADKQLLEHFTPAAVIVSVTRQIVRVYGAMDRYLRIPQGEATLDVVALVPDALKPALRTALDDAIHHHRGRTIEVMDTAAGRARSALRVTVRPLDDEPPSAAEPLFLLVFEKRPLERAAGDKGRGTAVPPDLVRRLQAELREARTRQQQLVAQLDRGDASLRAARDHALSTSEELQAANEELVVSAQALQWRNEELASLNAQLDARVHELSSVNDHLHSLFAATDALSVVLDSDLRVERFTAAAAGVLNLGPADVGRPLSDLTIGLVNVDLQADARAVLDRGITIDRETAADGTEYAVRLIPCRDPGAAAAPGVVLNLLDLTALKSLERDVRATRGELIQVNETLERCTAEWARWFGLLQEVALAIDNAQPGDDVLSVVLSRVCERGGWQVGYIYLPNRKDPNIIAIKSRFVEKRFRAFHAASAHARYARGEGLPGRVFEDAAPIWVDAHTLLPLLGQRGDAARDAGLQSALATPIRFDDDGLAVLELLSDRPHEPDAALVGVMSEVGAHIARVLERERSTAQMAELIRREQVDLLHTLHDSLGQTLTSIGMMAAALRRRLKGANPRALEDARQIATQARVALEQIRQLSRGLFAVDFEPDGLLQGLQELAATISSLYKIHVRAHGELPTAVRDGRVAAQLYRIAQEAVTNAVKHGRPHAIDIELKAQPGLATLQIVDDGVGFPSPPPRRYGLGLRIMRYRAASIGARLSVERGSAGGTTVTCTFREAPAAASLLHLDPSAPSSGEEP